VLSVKRNWDTIRELLTRVEECTLPGDTLQLSSFPSERAPEIAYHMALLIEARLVKGEMVRTIHAGPTNFLAQRLTWEGHEFLDAIRSNTVWGRTKKMFAEKGVEMTFDLVKTIAKEAAATLMKGAVGG
jgi:hypothetical protein